MYASLGLNELKFNPSGPEAGIFREKCVNIMAPCSVESSLAMLLTM